MNKIIISLAFVVTLSFFAAADTAAQKTVRVRFAKGTTSKTVRGRIVGYKYVDYLVNVREGQILTASLDSTNTFANFAIFDPNMENVDEAAVVTEYSGTLLKSGDYVVRVLMTRNEARRKGALADYSLSIRVVDRE